VWDLHTGHLIRTFGELGKGSPSSLAFLPDGITVVSVDPKGMIFWDTTAGTLLRSVETVHAYEMALSADGTRALTRFGTNEGAKLWDVATGELLFEIQRRSGDIISVAFSPDGRHLAAGALGEDDSAVMLWRTATGRPELTLPFGRGDLPNPVFVTAAALLTNVGSVGLEVWDIASGKSLRSVSIGLDYTSAIALSPSGTRVVIGGGPRGKTGAELYDFANWQRVFAFETGGSVGAVAFSPDGKRVMTGSQLWDAETGKLLQTFTGHVYSVNSVAFSPDGTRVLTGSSDKTANLWDASSGALLRTFGPYAGSIDGVAFLRNGTQVLLATRETLALHDVATGEVVRAFRYQERAMKVNESLDALFDRGRAVVSPDERRILTGSGGVMRLWNTDTGELLATFIGASDGEWITYTPEGFFDASKDGAKLILVYQNDAWIPMERAYDTLHRPDLLQQKLAGDPDGKVKAAAASLALR
jgi:WD40 repeat protein